MAQTNSLKSMLKFSVIIIVVFSIQIVTYVICNEVYVRNISADLLMGLYHMFISSMLVLYGYFHYRTSLKKLLGTSKKSFYVTLIFTWTMLCFVSAIMLNSLMSNGLLHYNNCGQTTDIFERMYCYKESDLPPFAGLEYVIVIIVYFGELAVVIFGEIILSIREKKRVKEI